MYFASFCRRKHAYRWTSHNRAKCWFQHLYVAFFKSVPEIPQIEHSVLSLICSDFCSAMITPSRRLLYFNYSKLTWQAFQIDYIHMQNIKYKITYNTCTKMKTKTATIYFMISEILYFVSFLYLVVLFRFTFCFVSFLHRTTFFDITISWTFKDEWKTKRKEEILKNAF